MKLYATTTSDRKDAKSGNNISKGLGGNEWIDVEVTYQTEKKEILKFLTLEILPQSDGIEVKYILDKTIAYLTEEKQKGKQKKWCRHYEYLPYKEEDLYEDCAYCKENDKSKGKQKKGECGAIDCKNPAEHTYKGILYCDGHYTQIHATE